MASFGIFHNGSTNLPLKKVENPDGEKDLFVPDASVDEVFKDDAEVLRSQIDQGILADELGYDRFILTEHRFQIAAAEFNPNPLMTQAVVASHTDNITLTQIANILPWHEPLRLAEQLATLDIISDGRVQPGFGRGYQPRETEVMGQYWGGTVQDQEKNRVVFEEKVEILLEALDPDNHLISYDGEEHTIPPSHTKHHHVQERLYLEDDVTEYEVEDMLEWKDEGDDYSDLWNDVVSGGTLLTSVPVTPKVTQDTVPVFWTPATSPRTVEWAAENGANQYMLLGGEDAITQMTDLYYTKAEEAGWPDPRSEYDGEPFKYGWDEDRQRGVGTYKAVFNTDAYERGSDPFKRWKQGLEHMWDYYGPFGFIEAAFDEEDKYDGGYVDGDTIIDAPYCLVGDSETIVNDVSELFENVGFEDVLFDFYFERSSLQPEEIEKQMEVTAEKVIPYLREEFEG